MQDLNTKTSERKGTFQKVVVLLLFFCVHVAKPFKLRHERIFFPLSWFGWLNAKDYDVTAISDWKSSSVLKEKKQTQR